MKSVALWNRRRDIVCESLWIRVMRPPDEQGKVGSDAVVVMSSMPPPELVARTAPAVSTMNITKSSRVHIGPKFVSVTQNVENTELVKAYPCPLYVWRVVRNTTRAERLSCACAALALALCMALIFYFTYAARQEEKVVDRAPHEWNITLEDWLARDQMDNTTVDRFSPLKLVIVQHTVSPECHRFTDCAAEMRNLQGYFMDSAQHGYDLPYNFVIGNDGRVYQSRGWNREGAHTAGYNRCSLGVGFIGDYRSTELIHSRVTALQLQRFSMLLEEGVARGFLRPDYSILGAMDVRPTVSPGDILYDALKTMEHFEHKFSFRNMTCEEVYDKLGIPYD